MVTGGTWGVLSDRANGRYRREGSAVGVSYSGGYSAEWIVEDYANAADGSAVPLARFATIDFSSLTTSLSTWSLATAGQIQLVRGGDSLAVPSPNPGGGFAVTDTA